MSLVARDRDRRCPRCHLLFRRFVTSLPSGSGSPWCRACTVKRGLLAPRPEPPDPDPTLPFPWSAVRATLHDPEAEPELRRFAFAVLRDARCERSDDWQAALQVALAQEQAPGAHGAATEGPESPGAGLDAQADRRGGQSAEESSSDGGA